MRVDDVKRRGAVRQSRVAAKLSSGEERRNVFAREQ